MYMSQKRRTQLYLDQRQKKLLKQQSFATGKSVGQLVREAIDEVYPDPEPVEKLFKKDNPIWKLIGSATGKETDISANHDKYLYGVKK